MEQRTGLGHRIRDEASIGTAGGWYEWVLTDLTTAWIQDALAYHGVEIEGDENVQERQRAFYPRETTTAHYPRLVVSYSVIDDTQPPLVAVDPLPAYSDRDFTVAWSGSDQGSAGLRDYDVQYQVDGGAWVNWQSAVTTTSAEFVGGVNGHTYGFRARGVDNAGNVEPFGVVEAQTVVDTRPPAAAVQALPSLTYSATFTVTWSGTDNAAGIHYYDVRYRYNGSPWLVWQNHTLATSALFSAMLDGLYQFEARAVDHAGQVESFLGQPEAGTIRDLEAPYVVPQAWFPLLSR